MLYSSWNEHSLLDRVGERKKSEKIEESLRLKVHDCLGI